MFLIPPVAVPLLAWPAKRHDEKRFKHAMQMLRLTFETKLGQFGFLWFFVLRPQNRTNNRV